MLTLASNERIPLTDSMRLLLEINHMNHCSPATVSRGGVIFMNGAKELSSLKGLPVRGGACTGTATAGWPAGQGLAFCLCRLPTSTVAGVHGLVLTFASALAQRMMWGGTRC